LQFAEGEVKFHFKTLQSNKNFTDDEAVEMKGNHLDFAQRDLVETTAKKDFPKWDLKIQVMTDEQSNRFPFNPVNLIKIWP
jgi:catalase